MMYGWSQGKDQSDRYTATSEIAAAASVMDMSGKVWPTAYSVMMC